MEYLEGYNSDENSAHALVEIATQLEKTNEILNKIEGHLHGLALKK